MQWEETILKNKDKTKNLSPFVSTATVVMPDGRNLMSVLDSKLDKDKVGWEFFGSMSANNNNAFEIRNLPEPQNYAYRFSFYGTVSMPSSGDRRIAFFIVDTNGVQNNIDEMHQTVFTIDGSNPATGGQHIGNNPKLVVNYGTTGGVHSTGFELILLGSTAYSRGWSGELRRIRDSIALSSRMPIRDVRFVCFPTIAPLGFFQRGNLVIERRKL